MIGSLLRLASIACALILLASFGLFAIDQARNGSKQTVATLDRENGGSATPVTNVNQPDPSPANERQREKQHGQVREAIDDADDVLVSPFSGIVPRTSSVWVQRGVTTLLALLVFGVGLRFLAGFVAGGRRR